MDQGLKVWKICACVSYLFVYSDSGYSISISYWHLSCVWPTVAASFAALSVMAIRYVMEKEDARFSSYSSYFQPTDG